MIEEIQQHNKKEIRKKAKASKKDKDDQKKKRQHREMQGENGHRLGDESNSIEGDMDRKRAKKKKKASKIKR